jgi:hypothetical protein
MDGSKSGLHRVGGVGVVEKNREKRAKDREMQKPFSRINSIVRAGREIFCKHHLRLGQTLAFRSHKVRGFPGPQMRGTWGTLIFYSGTCAARPLIAINKTAMNGAQILMAQIILWA